MVVHQPRSADITEARVKDIEDLWAYLDARNLRPEVVHGQVVVRPKAGVPLYLIADPLREPCRVALLADPGLVDPETNADD
jgi:hypothetical protein